MFEITCPKCHYRAVSSVEGTTAVCGRCKTSYPIPRGYTLLESSFKYAADARQRRDFSAAQASYTEILKQHPGNAAAYWFRAISRYQVEYQKIGEGQYRLVCHQALLKDFAADADVRKAISLADAQEAAYYNAESARISQLQKQGAKKVIPLCAAGGHGHEKLPSHGEPAIVDEGLYFTEIGDYGFCAAHDVFGELGVGSVDLGHLLICPFAFRTRHKAVGMPAACKGTVRLACFVIGSAGLYSQDFSG